MYRHHNFEERLNVVRRILCGEPIKLVCRSLSLDENLVRQWYLRYKKYGEEGLRGTRSYHYSAKEKAMIVKEYAEKGITLHEICLRYNLNRSTIKCWIKKVRKGLSLENKQRGRPPKTPMARPKKKKNTDWTWKASGGESPSESRETPLTKKKVKALVEEQEARARHNGQKPSMD